MIYSIPELHHIVTINDVEDSCKLCIHETYFTATTYKVILVFDNTTYDIKYILKMKGFSKHTVRSCIFDNGDLIVGYRENQLIVWESTGFNEVFSTTTNSDIINVCYDNFNSLLYIAESEMITIYQTPSYVRLYSRDIRQTNFVKLSNNGKILATDNAIYEIDYSNSTIKELLVKIASLQLENEKLNLLLSTKEKKSENYSDDILYKIINGQNLPQTLSELRNVETTLKNVLARIEVKKVEVMVKIKDKICCLCMDKQTNIAFSPCGHICVCFRCGEEINQCPLCRSKIQLKVKVFI